MTVDVLNQRYGVADEVRFVAGPNGFPIAEIVNQWATARVALHGAHLLAFTPKGHRPVIWLSDQAIYKAGKAIRGGIPIIWPWFGAHPTDLNLGSHGFVRNHRWQLATIQSSDDGSTALHLHFGDSGLTQAVWPYAFQLELIITVGKALTVTLAVKNSGEVPFSYTAALHSYFAVSDAREVEVHGLAGTGYLDKPNNFAAEVQQGAIRFQGEIDKVFQNSTADCLVVDKAWQRTLRVAKKGSATTVVWNPGPDIVRNMVDFADDSYQEMVCVETANAFDDLVTLLPGSQAELVTIISVE